jgi:hypothetical protein
MVATRKKGFGFKFHNNGSNKKERGEVAMAISKKRGIGEEIEGG